MVETNIYQKHDNLAACFRPTLATASRQNIAHLRSAHHSPYDRSMRILTLCIMLVGCSNTQATHLGNPLLLPIGAVTTGVENGFYNARRKRVAAYIAANKPALRADVIARPAAPRWMDYTRSPKPP